MSVTTVERTDGLITTGYLGDLARELNKPGGGFTVSATSGFPMRAGYALSLHPEREQQIGGRVCADDLMNYIRDNWDLLGKPGVVLGGWRDRESGRAFLDVSTVVHDRERAGVLARAHKQLAYFDLRTGCEIRV
jgi:hypothetical protein